MLKKITLSHVIKCICVFAIIGLINVDLNAQKDSINSVDAKGLKHGVWKKMEYGKLTYEGAFNHGNPIGKFTYYYDDGKTLKSVSVFSSNGKIAHVTSYHFNGQKSSYGKYIDKVKDSTWVYYGDNGILLSEEQYKAGKKNGVWKQYDYETGKLLEEVGWKNDQFHGLTQTYMLNGKVRYFINYKDGKASGPFGAFYINGNVSEKGVYKNSLKDSITTNFDETGRVIRKRKWSNGTLDSDRYWIWSDAGKKEVDADSISYLYLETRTFTVVTRKGERIKGAGDWGQYLGFLNVKGFVYYTPMVYGSINAPRRLEEIEEGIYKVVFKQDPGFDVIMKDSELAYLKSMRPKLFKKK